LLSGSTTGGLRYEDNIKVESFLVVTPCSVVVGYQRFRVPCCLKMEVARYSKTLISYHTVSQPRRTRLKSSPPWKPQISIILKCILQIQILNMWTGWFSTAEFYEHSIEQPGVRNSDSLQSNTYLLC